MRRVGYADAMALERSGLRALPLPLLVSFALLIAMVAGSLSLALRLSENVRETGRISDYRKAITDVISYARDAETGQRGYLLTHDAAYLQPYRDAVAFIEPGLAEISRSAGGRGIEVERDLRSLVRAKFSELERTIALERSGDHARAIAVVQTGEGRRLMDRMRAVFEGERHWAILRSNALSADSVRAVRELTFGLVGGIIAIVLLSLLWLRQTRTQFAETEAARRVAEQTLAALRRESEAREASEGQVRQMQKMESIGQLTGGIAHDFNNMLAVVMGGLELAKRRLRSDPDRAEACIDNAREGATRAAALTARLLAFSRSSPLAPKPTDLNKLVGGMSELLARTLGETISVETVLGAGLWRCYADAGEIENALLNLAVNARDAMPDGGKLTIETANSHIDDAYARSRSDVEAGQYVAICVSDTGGGMPPEVIERAFDPFFTTKAVGKGTGLGLSQVFGFAKQSGGHAAIYSEVGEGSTVKLYLPRFMGVETADAAVAAPDAAPGGNELILVVEDEQRVRHFAVDVLRELGYGVVSAESPAEALRLIEATPGIELLFTDIVMPEMNGRRLAELALEVRPDLKVLYTTGYTRNAVVHNGVLDIGVAFLTKPYTISDLARKVRDVIDGGGVNRSV